MTKKQDREEFYVPHNTQMLGCVLMILISSALASILILIFYYIARM